MGTADPKLDGRLDGVFTAATLPAANSVPAGTQAFTSDRGRVVSDGANWIASPSIMLSGSDARLQYNVPITAFNVQMTDVATHLILEPAGTLAAGTVALPANPVDANEIAISTTQTVTALTLSAPGKTITTAVTTLAAGATVRYRYRAANTTWYKAS